MYVTFAPALFLCVYGLYRRYILLRLGQPENRFDRPGERIRGLIIDVLGQKRVLREWFAGIMHFMIFWGFLLLAVGTTVVFVEADLKIPVMRGPFYLYFQSLALDIVGVLVIAGVCIALYRRWRPRPGRPASRPVDWLILVLLLVILVTGYVLEGLRINGTQDPWALWSPVGLAVGNLFTAAGVSMATQLWLHRFTWWLHMLLAFGFIGAVAYSRYIHLLACPVNTYFRSLEPRGTVKPLDFEDESVNTYGVARIEQFTWKQLLDLLACTECGRCQDNCPAHLSGKPLSPERLTQNLKNHLLTAGPALLVRSRQKGAGGEEPDEEGTLVGSVVKEEEVWACTTCLACEVQCPLYVEHTGKTIDLRRNLVLMESRFPSEATGVFRNMENNGNPWGIGWASRADWAGDLGVRLLSDGEPVDLLYWAGCAGSFDDRNRKVATALVRIMQGAGIDFGILGTEEKCCGDSARRMGNEYLFQTLAAENIERMNGYGVKKVVTHCPHCYNTLKKDYPQLGGRFEVLHHTELIWDLIRQGRVAPGKGGVQGLKATYHDSCYLGRHNDIYDVPRRILGSVPGLQVAEMTRTMDKSFCCGAGGGRMWLEETIGQRINEMRTDQALEAGVQAIATACPFCLTMFEDGLKARDRVDVQVMDVAELVARYL